MNDGVSHVDSDVVHQSDDDNKLVLEILDRFLQNRENGVEPDIESAIEQFPHLENQLRECLQGLEAMDLFADVVQDDHALDSKPSYPEFSDYRILGQLGRGGMGIVYHAEQISLQREVALKVLPLAAIFDRKNLQRFKNEANATARLNHEHIINVYSFGCENGIHFYAMQYVDGQSLADVVRTLRRSQPDQWVEVKTDETFQDSGRNENKTFVNKSTETMKAKGSVTKEIGLSKMGEDGSSVISLHDGCSSNRYLRSVTQLGVQVADALFHAHEMGIVHRDIKPSNLLLDSRGKVSVSDFGLAQVQSNVNLTLTGDIVGTLKYMSPEQAQGADLVDHRTDIYSLGATLYELLTLQPVIRGKDRKEILKNLINENIIAPSRINSKIPFDLETVILKALEPSRDNRYSSAREFADDLNRVLDDQPIHARRATVGQRIGKWMRRNRWFASTAAIFGALLLIGSFASAVWISYKHEKLKEAEAALLVKNNHLQSALQRATSAETKVETNSEILQRLGTNFFEKRKYADAIKMLESALVLEDDAYQPQLLRAQALSCLSRTEEAEVAFNRLIKTVEDQDSEEALVQRGLFYYQLDRLNEATADLSASLTQQTSAQDKTKTKNRLWTEAMLLLFLAHWNSGELEEAKSVREKITERSNQFLQGDLYCINAIYFSRFGSKTDSELEFHKALRWYGYRLLSQPRLAREIINELIQTCNKELNREFDPRSNDTWLELKYLRIESTPLMELAAVEEGKNQLVSLQNGINTGRPGIQWTPFYPGKPINGTQMLWDVPADDSTVGSKLTIRVNELERVTYRHARPFEAGEYFMNANLTESSNFGTIQFWLNGAKIGQPIDTYIQAPAASESFMSQSGETDLGVVKIREGINELQIEIVGKNRRSAGYNVAVDFIDLWPVDFVPGKIEKE